MTNNNPLVSVIIPCYNAEKYVELAIRSIMEQSYKNLEIIVTNDCSTDKTLEILQQLKNEDPRIIIINNKKNLKIVKSLNNMIDLAHGKYIARMDADDISLKDRILEQVNFLESNPEYGICGCNSKIIEKSGKIIGHSYLPLTNEDINKFKFYSCPFYHPTVLIKAELLKTNKYDEKYLFAEDYELWFRLLKITKGHNLRQKYFKYRVFDEQTSKIKSFDQKEKTKLVLLNHTNFSENIIKFLTQNTCFDSEIKEFIRQTVTKNIYASIIEFIVLFKKIKIKLFTISPLWFLKAGFSCLVYFIKVKFRGI